MCQYVFAGFKIGLKYEFKDTLEFFTNFTKMPTLAFLSLLHENPQNKSSDKMLPLVGIEPGPFIASDSKSNTILSTLTWHLLVRLRL